MLNKEIITLLENKDYLPLKEIVQEEVNTKIKNRIDNKKQEILKKLRGE